MTEPPLHTDLILNLKRVFSVPPDRLFQIWTQPELMKRWFSPEGLTTVHAEVDLRIGGYYRIGMQSNDGAMYYVSGVYREIEAPSKLVFTWAWSYDLLPPRDDDMLVTIQFIGQGQNTEIVLTHTHLADAAAFEQHVSGWQGCLDKLDHYVSTEGLAG